MRVSIPRNVISLIAVVILILSNSRFLVDMGYSSAFEYMGYFFLLGDIIVSTVRKKKIQKHLYLFFVVLIMFSVGITLQNLDTITKIKLIFTMLVIDICAFYGQNIVSDIDALRRISNAILIGCILSIILTVATGGSILDVSHEGVFDFGFSAGLQFKNFFASNILAAYIGHSLYKKFEIVKKKRLEISILQFIELLLIFLSNSRGTYVLTMIYFVFFYFNDFVRIKKNQRKIVFSFFLVIGLGVGYEFYNNIAINSTTYMYRVNGLLNYLEYIVGDQFHLVFGNAELAYGSSTMTYSEIIRRTTGFNGSLEMSFLNILIKNGIVGLFGYVILFAFIYSQIIKILNDKVKYCALGLFFTLLISGFVESFISNIHSFFGVYSYIALASMIVEDKMKKTRINKWD